MIDPDLLPSPAFAGRSLHLVPLPSRSFYRAFRSEYPDPLGFRPTPSRFSDPMIGTRQGKPFGTVYFGESVEVCILETIIRDTGIGRGDHKLPVAESQLAAYSIAEISCREELALLDLRGGGTIRPGIPTDAVRASDQSLGQAWAAAIHTHPDEPDGILFSSRLNEQTNLALFDRALGKLAVTDTAPLMDLEDELSAILDKYEVALT